MEERVLAELGQRLDHAAAGAEKLFALVGDDDVRALAAGKVLLNLIGEMMDIDNGALDALLGEAVEHVVDQRLAADLHERLGELAVERAHARAEPGSEHHRAFRPSRDCCAQRLQEFRPSTRCALERLN